MVRGGARLAHTPHILCHRGAAIKRNMGADLSSTGFAAEEGVAKGWQDSVGAASAANGPPEINDLRGHSRINPLPQGRHAEFCDTL